MSGNEINHHSKMVTGYVTEYDDLESLLEAIRWTTR